MFRKRTSGQPPFRHSGCELNPRRCPISFMVPPELTVGRPVNHGESIRTYVRHAVHRWLHFHITFFFFSSPATTLDTHSAGQSSLKVQTATPTQGSGVSANQALLLGCKRYLKPYRGDVCSTLPFLRVHHPRRFIPSLVGC